MILWGAEVRRPCHLIASREQLRSPGCIPHAQSSVGSGRFRCPEWVYPVEKLLTDATISKSYWIAPAEHNRTGGQAIASTKGRKLPSFGFARGIENNGACVRVRTVDVRVVRLENRPPFTGLGNSNFALSATEQPLPRTVSFDSNARSARLPSPRSVVTLQACRPR